MDFVKVSLLLFFSSLLFSSLDFSFNFLFIKHQLFKLEHSISLQVSLVPLDYSTILDSFYFFMLLWQDQI